MGKRLAPETVTITLSELHRLLVLEHSIFQATIGISGNISNQACKKYGVPDAPSSFGFDVSIASDADLVQWARWCVKDTADVLGGVENFYFCGLVGSNTLPGVLLNELARRLAPYAGGALLETVSVALNTPHEGG